MINSPILVYTLFESIVVSTQSFQFSDKKGFVHDTYLLTKPLVKYED